MPGDEAVLTIGQVAARAGVKASRIRFYETRGVLPEPERLSGQRRYRPEAIRRLAMVQVAQQAGFSLDEIRRLMGSSEAGHGSAELRELAEHKLADVRALIARAETMSRWLEVATDCRCATLDECGLFEGHEGLTSSQVEAAS